MTQRVVDIGQNIACSEDSGFNIVYNKTHNNLLCVLFSAPYSIICLIKAITCLT